MPTVAVKKHFNFIRGLNTEAGPLTPVENCWTDGDNVVPGLDGAIELRKGLDYEPDFEKPIPFPGLAAGTRDNLAFATGEWNSVGGNSQLNFLVIQEGVLLTFWVNAGTVSAQRKTFTVDLSTYHAEDNTEDEGVAPVNMASVNGNLLVVSRDIEPIVVVYDADADDIDVTELDVQIRDLKGVEDGLAVNEPMDPTTTPFPEEDLHLYNLRNQGWPYASSIFGLDHLANYFVNSTINTGKYPANSMVWWVGKDANGDFDATLLDKHDFGTTPAPKGRHIINAFIRDRAAAGSFVGFPELNATEPADLYRPTTCAFFAGRAWYAGVRSKFVSTWVFFSQVAENVPQLAKCFQEADPTSENSSDLVATDGGYIPIQDAGTPLKLLPYGNSLLVICDNGVWQILGGSETGFAADSYEVRKITSIGCIAAKTVVSIDTDVLFWSADGIYIIRPTENGGLTVDCLSAESVQTFYTDIPMQGKVLASGTYSSHERVVYWGYSDDEAQDGIVLRFKKNRLLCLDIDLKCFYTMTIGELETESPFFVDLFVTKSSRGAAAADNVLKFVTVVPASGGGSGYSLTMSEFDFVNDAPRRHRDWYAEDDEGVSFTAELWTAYDFGAEQGADKKFGALYVLVYMRRTETGVDEEDNPINPSGITMQPHWEWTDSSAAGNQGPEKQVYVSRRVRPWIVAGGEVETDDGYPVVVTKNKVRGRGRALQLIFRSQEDKDMQLLGWAITYIGNESV